MTAFDHEVRTMAAALDRRAFLRGVGVLVAAGVLPTGCTSVPPHLQPRAVPPLRVLSPRGYAVFTAAAMRIVGPAGGALIRDHVADVGVQADGFLVRVPEVAGALQQALQVLEFGVYPLVAKLRPFTALDGTAQDAVLADCMASRFDLKRRLFGGIRAFALLAFYGTPASHGLSGYPGPFGSEQVTIADAMTTPDDWR